MEEELHYSDVAEYTPPSEPLAETSEAQATNAAKDASPTIGKLALALSKAQLKIEGAKKDASNPFFKSKYADLASVWDACHEALNENEIAIVQTTSNRETAIVIQTRLIHSSGEWIKGSLGLVPVKNDPQGIGSAISYGRRYALAAIAGVCPIDDDGEAAMGRKPQTAPQTAPQTTKADALVRLKEEAKKGPLAKQKIIKLMQASNEWTDDDVEAVRVV
jgi:hypothetical protein